jgi:hypothetical protein
MSTGSRLAKILFGAARNLEKFSSPLAEIFRSNAGKRRETHLADMSSEI